MKPLTQKLPLDRSCSFVAKTFRTPHFEVGWHQHIEYELILFTEGSGLSFVGNHVGEFDRGDIYFLGKQLPHSFQKREIAIVTSAVVVQFKEDFWGDELLELPESRAVKLLFAAAAYGLKVQGTCVPRLTKLIVNLEHARGFRRILLLAECLDLIAKNSQNVSVSTTSLEEVSIKDQERINRVFDFTISHFKEPLMLAEVASIACMSVPAFCTYFKNRTQKTYIDFLNQIRIGYACALLTDTDKPVLDIGYESGYNTLANFHKQFLKVKGSSPLQYRKLFRDRLPLPQRNIFIVE